MVDLLPCVGDFLGKQAQPDVYYTLQQLILSWKDVGELPWYKVASSVPLTFKVPATVPASRRVKMS